MFQTSYNREMFCTRIDVSNLRDSVLIKEGPLELVVPLPLILSLTSLTVERHFFPSSLSSPKIIACIFSLSLSLLSHQHLTLNLRRLFLYVNFIISRSRNTCRTIQSSVSTKDYMKFSVPNQRSQLNFKRKISARWELIALLSSAEIWGKGMGE